MTCEQISALLDLRLHGELDEQQQKLLNEHLETCLSCRFRAQAQDDGLSLDEDEEVPSVFSQQLRQRIMKEETPVKQSPRIVKWLAIAASLVVLVGGTYLAGDARRSTLNSASQSKARDYGGATYSEDYAADYAETTPMAAAPQANYEADRSLMAKEEAATGEKIIRTARMELSTRDFDKDYEAILAQVKQAGGRVENANLYNNYNNLRVINLTLRIPVNQLDKVINSFKGVGRLVSFSESAQDVSEQYKDIDMRLTTQKTKMERLQALLQKAESVEDLIALEGGISETQYEIDRLTGSLRGLDSQVDYATLDLALNELSPLETSKDQQEGLMERIKNGMAAAFDGFVLLLGDLVVFLSIILPYLLVLVVVVLIIRTLIKRRKNK